jgi:hypothetical protein
MVDPVSLSCRKVTYPTAMADIYSSPAISCFAWCSGVVCGLLASVLCRGRRRQGTRVQGSGTIGGVWSVAVALNTRQGTFARCAARSASTIWLSHCTLGPSRWYLTRMTLLLRPVLEPRTNSTSLVVDNPLIDRNDPVLSAPHAFTSPVVAKTFAFIPAPGSCSAA